MGRHPQEPTSPTHNCQPNLEEGALRLGPALTCPSPNLNSCLTDDTASGLHPHRQPFPQCRLTGKDGKPLLGLSPSAHAPPPTS